MLRSTGTREVALPKFNIISTNASKKKTRGGMSRMESETTSVFNTSLSLWFAFCTRFECFPIFLGKDVTASQNVFIHFVPFCSFLVLRAKGIIWKWKVMLRAAKQATCRVRTASFQLVCGKTVSWCSVHGATRANRKFLSSYGDDRQSTEMWPCGNG